MPVDASLTAVFGVPIFWAAAVVTIDRNVFPGVGTTAAFHRVGILAAAGVRGRVRAGVREKVLGAIIGIIGSGVFIRSAAYIAGRIVISVIVEVTGCVVCIAGRGIIGIIVEVVNGVIKQGRFGRAIAIGGVI